MGPAVTTPTDQVIWRQANPAYIVIQFFRNVRPMVLPFAIIFVSGGARGGIGMDSWYLWITLAIGIGIAISSVISWRFFRFGLSDRQLLVRSGILNKQERAVAYERIQAVNIEEAPLDRVFGVVRVQVETAAGGGGKESDIQIEALRRDEAEQLRTWLGQARQHLRQEASPEAGPTSATPGTGIGETIPDEGELIHKLSVGELLLAGATSGRIGPAAAIVGFGAQFADDVVPQSMWERLPWSDVASVVSSVQTVFLVVLVLGLIAWVLSVISTVLSIGGFEIRRHDDQLLLRFGLLDRRRLTIPVRRIQAVRVVEGVLRQPFGLAELRFETAGYTMESGEHGMLLPILRHRDTARFLQDVVPDFAFDPVAISLRPVPARALRRYVMPGAVQVALAVTVVVAIAWRVTGDVQDWSLYLYLLVLVVAVYGWLEFRDAGWHLDGDRLVMRGRTGARETVITRRQRLQHRRVEANWFQRRARLVTFRASVAAGGSGGGLAIANIESGDGDYLLAALAATPRFRFPNPTASSSDFGR